MYDQLQPGGYGLGCGAHSTVCGGGTSGRFLIAGLGGHGEGLRRSRDDAAGVQLGASPVDRKAVNVGTGHVAVHDAHSSGMGAGDRRIAR